MSRIVRVFRRPRPVDRQLSFAQWPAAVYAIGDVHGCYEQLLALEREIVIDAAGFDGEKWIVMLGDYVDRGPDSALVLAHLLSSQPAGLRRFCLMGNHEAVLLNYLASPWQHREWLAFGGEATLASYGQQDSSERPALPLAHVDFLRSLPYTLSLPGVVFVHAGLRPGVPLSEQSPEDLLWIREPFLSTPDPLPRVVHGHTPGTEPVVTSSRICVDTAAFSSGVLTAVRVRDSDKIRILDSRGRVADADWPNTTWSGQ